MYKSMPFGMVAKWDDGRGPVFSKTFSRVVFRIINEKQLRVFDGRAFDPVGGTPQQWCQAFIDLRCRDFLRLDGYDPFRKESKSVQIISREVDYYYCDHPTVTI
jgi:hypothetical protein